VNAASATSPDKGSCWGKLLLIAVLPAIAITVIGLVSDFMSTPGIDAETRAYLEGQIEESSGAGDVADPCWVGTQYLGWTDLPQHFNEGPDWRPESRLDTWFFRPGSVLRPGRDPGCGAESWGYVESRSALPFFVRTHFGYFSEEQSTNEGVRTYFTIFGKSILLNEWSVREQPE
jgi:hypothetical protein